MELLIAERLRKHEIECGAEESVQHLRKTKQSTSKFTYKYYRIYNKKIIQQDLRKFQHVLPGRHLREGDKEPQKFSMTTVGAAWKNEFTVSIFLGRLRAGEFGAVAPTAKFVSSYYE